MYKNKDKVFSKELEIFEKINELEQANRELMKKNIDLQSQLDIINNSNGMKALRKYYKVRDCYKPALSSFNKVLRVINTENARKVYKTLRTQGVKETFRKINSHLGMDNGFEIKDLVLVPLIKETDDVEKYDEITVPKFDNPKVSIIIPVYNQFNYTYNCVLSIVRNCGLEIPYEILIADDKSTDITRFIEKKIVNVRVIRNEENLRFLRNCNNAAKYALGDYILFLNNDTQVQKEWLDSLVSLIESDEKIGMVGSKLIYPNGTLQEAGGILCKDGSAWNYGNGSNPNLPEFNYVKEVDYISGASIMIRSSLWNQLGGFDEHFVPAYCEDSDLAFSVRKAGYKVIYQPKSVVVHFEGVSHGKDVNVGLKAYQIENSKKFFVKWKEVLEKEHFENGENVFVARDRSRNKRCILFIDHYVPTFDKDAGSRTVFQYLKLFVEIGYNVKFIGDNFAYNKFYVETLEKIGIEVLYGKYYQDNWKKWMKENANFIDYVFLNRPHISIKYIEFLKDNLNAQIIYYGHDLHYLREIREYELTNNKELIASSKYWKEIELSLMSKADISLYPSMVEVNEIKKINKDINVNAIPGYIYKYENVGKYDATNRKNLMFIGGFSHRPNVDAVVWFHNYVWPIVLKARHDIKIYILGSNPPDEIKKLNSENFVVRGFVTDKELDEFYKDIRISVVPLRYGAGVKGKVIEGLFNQMPIITTSVGAEGIATNDAVLVIADTPEDFANKILLLYDDVLTLNIMSNKAKNFINNNYTMDSVKKVIGKIFEF